PVLVKALPKPELAGLGVDSVAAREPAHLSAPVLVKASPKPDLAGLRVDSFAAREPCRNRNLPVWGSIRLQPENLRISPLRCSSKPRLNPNLPGLRVDS